MGCVMRCAVLLLLDVLFLDLMCSFVDTLPVVGVKRSQLTMRLP